MFNGHGGLVLEGDHLDVTYRKPDLWPNFTPGGSLKAFVFDIGDAEKGPNVQLGLMSRVAGETEHLDWKHSIDPVHHHGSDQFRLIVGGDWVLAGRPMTAGDYAFQESGWVYQEHPGPEHQAWMLLVMGDRRGTRATLRLARDQSTLVDSGDLADIYGVPRGDEPYPHPAGHKGLAAIATDQGDCERGYRLGRIADLGEGGVLTGLLGDPEAGPAAHVLKSGPGRTVVPACAWSTELVLAVAKGSCRIGEVEYEAGDIRIQRADAPLADVVAGPDGMKGLLLVADRRVRARLQDVGAAPTWMDAPARIQRNLRPVPGGARGRLAAAG